MQLPAAQTSLEPQPRRADPVSRRPFVSQNATNDDGSRFASELTRAQRLRVLPTGSDVELNKLPNTSRHGRLGRRAAHRYARVRFRPGGAALSSRETLRAVVWYRAAAC
jgi:hypothetical protein